MTDIQDLKVAEGLHNLTNTHKDIDGIDTLASVINQIYNLNKRLELAEDDPDLGLTREDVQRELAETYLNITPTVIDFLLLSLQLLTAADNVFNKQKALYGDSETALNTFIDQFNQNYTNLLAQIGLSEQELTTWAEGTDESNG